MPLDYGGQTFIHEEGLKSFAFSYSVNQNDLKHELPLGKEITPEKTSATYIISGVLVIYLSL